MTTPVLDLASGDYMLPAGKIAMVVTYLEQRAPPQREPFGAPAGVSLKAWPQVDIDAYLDLFKAIGAPWLWFGRLLKSRTYLEALFADPNHKTWAVVRDTQKIGLLELDGQDDGNVEVSYFGFTPGQTGKGLGSWLMDQAQRLAWADQTTKRVWVHTCSADDPKALPFYQKMGFIPYARGIEIADDPRLTGIHSDDAGPAALPLIR
ncbi:acetyltransferase GNAT family protein [Asticcacaulis biprosthecium C19]|uniref:Acetyltransferase GNAT family protein n=1 Tax=Asticcacaulis biprosthecium C19 TaxID=715226 RepID=F4QR03_9CAUL|nr:GNAT family N-acetyltransferase [Asticcacaulis biprosthecium]EGF90640.1 acetyltransferase GNAT family protein [Asticcacaulis biprosthecium C19]